MPINKIDPNYPVSLRAFANDPSLPVTAAMKLMEAAKAIQSLLAALEAAQPQLADREFVVVVRATLPEDIDLEPAGSCSVNVSSGRLVDPGNPILLSAAHDAIVACVIDMQGPKETVQ